MWRINGTLHSPSFLPPGYTANENGLYFQARQDLNLSNYQCLFNVYNAVAENIEMVASRTGTLFVTQGQCIMQTFLAHEDHFHVGLQKFRCLLHGRAK